MGNIIYFTLHWGHWPGEVSTYLKLHLHIWTTKITILDIETENTILSLVVKGQRFKDKPSCALEW